MIVGGVGGLECGRRYVVIISVVAEWTVTRGKMSEFPSFLIL